MKLFYYQDEVGNFGDDLNPWLWDRLLPDFFDDDESSWLVGIGTLLNHKLPAYGRKYVLGSGYGYGKPPVIEDCHFFCVRGPKTAQKLNLDPALALTDPAILVRTVYAPISPAKHYKFGFMPHYLGARLFSWSDICSRIGFNYISPEWPVDKVLNEMADCEVMITEAMHGAIVADALRIPWIPVQCYDYVSTFKWEDWLLTVNLPYKPIKITSVYDIVRRMSISARGKNILKCYIKGMGMWLSPWAPPKPANSSRATIDQATEDLLQASRTPPFLSKNELCDALTDRYLEVLDQVRQVRKGS